MPLDGSSVSSAVAATNEREPCPSPLNQQQVVAAFRRESRAWELNHNGITLRGRTWGTGPPLYLLNGLGGTHELYAMLVWLLRDRFCCIVYDYPQRLCTHLGQPRVAGSRKKLTAEHLVDDLCAVADLHSHDRFCVWATSFGCVVALTALWRQPDLIERAVLQGGFAHRSLSLAERILIRLGRHLPGQFRRFPFREAIQQQNHRLWFPPFDYSRWKFFLENTGDVTIADLADRAAIVRDFDGRVWLREIERPVLLVHGEGDGTVAERCHHELKTNLRNSRAEWLHNCGYLPYLTHPHRLVKVVRSFLTDGDTDTERLAVERVSRGTPES